MNDFDQADEVYSNFYHNGRGSQLGPTSHGEVKLIRETIAGQI